MSVSTDTYYGFANFVSQFYDDRAPLYYSRSTHLKILTRMLNVMFSKKLQFKLINQVGNLNEVLSKVTLDDPFILVSEPLLALLINENITDNCKQRVTFVDDYDVFEGLISSDKTLTEQEPQLDTKQLDKVRFYHLIRLGIACKHFQRHIQDRIPFKNHEPFKHLLRK